MKEFDKWNELKSTLHNKKDKIVIPKEREVYWASIGLNIGFWSFSFGLASLANGAVSFVHHNVLSGLANGAFIFANVMMSGLVLMTLGKIFKGQFWLK